MLKKLIWILPVLALVGGAVGGDLLAPQPEAKADETAAEGEHAAAEGEHPATEGKAEAEGDHAAPDGEPAAEGGHGAEETEAHGADQSGHGGSGHGSGESEGGNAPAWFSFPNQFFVPLVARGEIGGIMVLTISIETTEAERTTIENHEHHLRDALLRALIVHANTGGFSGNYTDAPKLDRLRAALLKAAVDASGTAVHAVLIEDIGLAGT
ncbi:hypothetical protein [Paracoccus zhejiangensis]|uniref:Flagellar basal body-associated protein FliL n=1 Tax=Paracoccus zhejiangensis TaxID=1077935 RepID=A0A2H5F2A8_9RHOB|nr:hypothetical protein [Paracoccus zhejiangensis]AUH65685.1 hypothetical protein CX676_17270 [Paracoccus zhejiangensis]